MSSASGIGISKELSDTFAAAVEGNSVRFIIVTIENESLLPKSTVPIEGSSLEDDLEKLQGLLEDNAPVYVLARVSDSKNLGWLAISYVPDTATVRGKMLYASTRAALTKSLGSTHFSDSLFATSKADLTPKAYAAHKAHLAAPQPLSAREQEIADARAAEKAAGAAYEGSSARRNHVGQVGAKWSEEAEKAIKDLATGNNSALVLLAIDKTETLVLSSASECDVGELASRIPASDPSFAFYAWSRKNGGAPKRDIVFIYTCPSSSPVKSRMLYSCQTQALFHVARPLLEPALASRKIETSDPNELTEELLKSELGLDSKPSQTIEANSTRPAIVERGFARPKGPGRR